MMDIIERLADAAFPFKAVPLIVDARMGIETLRAELTAEREKVKQLTAERDELLASSTRIKLELAELRDQEPTAYEWRLNYANGGYVRHFCTDIIEAKGYDEAYLDTGLVTPLFAKAGDAMRKEIDMSTRHWREDGNEIEQLRTELKLQIIELAEANANEFRAIWLARHCKTGNVYEVIGEAVNATNGDFGDKMVLYRRQGVIYVRSTHEFRNRFVKVEDNE
jgi:hypothetical protein